jgi:thiamine biosynthesis lipoprotein
MLEARMPVMGTTAHVLVVGCDRLVDVGLARLAQLEGRWSRFRPTSEISQLNDHPGRPVIVSADTFHLVELAIEGWRETEGVFDPTVAAALRRVGYDRDFSLVAAHVGHRVLEPAAAAPGCARIELDPRLLSITLPFGVALDAGGIGKGLAADIVTAELMAAGARGALVNVGGDLRVRGESPIGSAWNVAIEDPTRDPAEICRVDLVDGAIATSSRMQRRWQTGSGPMHHLIDPRSGGPARTPIATVAAVTRDAWWAEVVAKTVLIGNLSRAQYRSFGAIVTTIDEDGTVVTDGTLQEAVA